MCFKECVFPSRLWQGIGTLCTAHLIPNVIISLGNWAVVPGYSWHGNEAKHLHKGRGSGHTQKVQDATHDVIPFICVSLWCAWLKATTFLQYYRGTSGLVAEYFNCFFTLHHMRKLQIASLKPDVSIQPPPALAPFHLPIPVYMEVAGKVHLCVQIPPLWWNYTGDEFRSLHLLGRTQRVAPITSCVYHLRPILILIPAQSANSLGVRNPPLVPMHITKGVFSSVQL